MGYGASFAANTAFRRLTEKDTDPMSSPANDRTLRCPLCGLDPSIDDHDAPPNSKRCIECGRVMREVKQ